MKTKYHNTQHMGLPCRKSRLKWYSSHLMETSKWEFRSVCHLAQEMERGKHLRGDTLTMPTVKDLEVTIPYTKPFPWNSMKVASPILSVITVWLFQSFNSGIEYLPLLMEEAFHNSQWMPEMVDSTKFYLCFFFPIYRMLMIKFNLPN